MDRIKSHLKKRREKGSSAPSTNASSSFHSFQQKWGARAHELYCVDGATDPQSCSGILNDKGRGALAQIDGASTQRWASDFKYVAISTPGALGGPHSHLFNDGSNAVLTHVALPAHLATVMQEPRDNETAAQCDLWLRAHIDRWPGLASAICDELDSKERGQETRTQVSAQPADVSSAPVVPDAQEYATMMTGTSDSYIKPERAAAIDHWRASVRGFATLYGSGPRRLLPSQSNATSTIEQGIDPDVAGLQEWMDC